MNVKLQNVGKRFERNWIFRNISLEFTEGKRYAVLGPNGSGKSTLMRITSGNVMPTEGGVEYTKAGGKIGVDEVFTHVSIAAPYLELPEEYSLQEIITFHKTFKSIEKNLSAEQVIEVMELAHTKEKLYKYFSSGMKQRVKLGLAILSATPLLLLDEPSTALDANAIAWYQRMIAEHGNGKTIIVFSNNKQEEFSFCEEKFQINNQQ